MVASLSVIVFLLVKLSLFAYSDGKAPFNETEARSHLAQLCSNFEANHLDGDMCNRICYGRAYQNVTVLNYMRGPGKIVLVLFMGGQKVVLKTETPDFWKFDQIHPSIDGEEFLEQLRMHVNAQTELGWPETFSKHLLDVLYPGHVRLNSDNLTLAHRRSLWTLVQQDEYVTFTVLASAALFPKLMGSCGHFYAVEYTVPFKMDSYFYGTVRSRILLHIMGTLKIMLGFMNEPLQWCDVKFEHFGLHIDYPKRFLILDGDMVFTQSRLERIFASLSCTRDADCRFFDCHSTCNTATGRCRAKRANDNVQVFCEKMIHELYGSFWTRANKLLEACHFISSQSSETRLTNVHSALVFGLPDV